MTIDSENQQTPQSRRFTSHEGEFVFINNMYIENQTINIPSKNVSKNDDIEDLKQEIELLKEQLNKYIKTDK